MKLIADSGSTKTDWCLMDETGILLRMTTQGINPIHQTQDGIKEILRILQSKLFKQPTTICFYGSGVTPSQ